MLRHKALTIGGALVLIVITLPLYFQLGSEFMPPLDEGTILYMPTTLPGISVTEAQQLNPKVKGSVMHPWNVHRRPPAAGQREHRPRTFTSPRQTFGARELSSCTY